MNIHQIIHDFIQEAVDKQLIDSIDQIYLQNRLLALLKLNDYRMQTVEQNSNISMLELLDRLVEYAVSVNIIDNTYSAREILAASIMDLLTPLPSQLNSRFWNLYRQSPEAATNYFYNISQVNNYIKTREIAKNINYRSNSQYGELQISINLSKPEKDPIEIAKARNMPQVTYPKCVLCMENEGYRGHLNHSARQNHRIIRLEVQDECYGFQYSPYVYYNEHSIFLSSEHRPMKVDRKCFENLVEIVDMFPHYFVGSNADLPGVGGSILSHDHYQGGHHHFPMEEAEVIKSYQLENFQDVEIQILKWPLSVIRLRSKHSREMVDLAELILNKWKIYDDKEVDIQSYSDQPHNTITPIARWNEGGYELDLVLRNNRTNKDYPLGIFHPHPDVHHIKKENIGLIEVMGLAILPARLVKEIEIIERYLLGKTTLDSVKLYHKTWAQELHHLYSGNESIKDYIKKAIAAKFQKVLEDAGVFKQTSNGLEAFERFIHFIQE